MSQINPVVMSGVAELCETFENSLIESESDGSGGAIVVVQEVPLGSPYAQKDVWFGFHITHLYPYADVYPHFTCADLSRIDQRSLGSGFGSATFKSEPAIQISRRSNRLNPDRDTAALKLLKVVKWMKEQS